MVQVYRQVVDVFENIRLVRDFQTLPELRYVKYIMELRQFWGQFQLIGYFSSSS